MTSASRGLLALAAAAFCTGCPTQTKTTQPSQIPSKTMTDAPSSMQPVVWPDEQFRYQKPVAGIPTELEIPDIVRFKLAQGPEVFLAPRPELPTVSMWLSFPTGGAADPAGKRGLSGMCMDLIGQGTASLEKVAYEERQADLAANVSSNSNAETVSVGLSTLRRNLEPALDLWNETLQEPGLRKEDLERLRSRRLASLAQNKAAPSSIARRLWRSIVMGPKHPYGTITSEADYNAITLRDCKKFHAALGAQNARLMVAGAIDPDEIRSLIGTRLEGWAERETTVSEVSKPAPREGTLFFVNVAGAAQSQVYIGHPGPKRTAPDYEANRMMAAILGGGFSSRVNMNIREDKGFAYGARARFTYFKHEGWFVSTTSVRTDATGEALTEIRTEIERMRTSAVTAEELEREREAILLSLPARFSTARRMLGTYSSLAFFGLPMDYYDGFVRRVQAVSAASVQQAAAKNLQATGFKVLVVGDGDEIRDDLDRIAASGAFGPAGNVIELGPDGA